MSNFPGGILTNQINSKYYKYSPTRFISTCFCISDYVLAEDRLTVFNSMDKLSIGLDLTETGSFSHPFFGLISGLTFNSIQVLDLAKSNHPSITIQGDAVLADLDDR